MWKSEIIVPFLMVICLIMSCIAVTYLNPQGPWVTAFYPFTKQHPIVLAAPIVDAIADCSVEHKLITVLISHDAQKENLRHQGAILIDPKGVPLCFWK